MEDEDVKKMKAYFNILLGPVQKVSLPSMGYVTILKLN